METEIKSPADGVISNIHIQVGDAVAPGDLLIDIA
jgi:biotin carboxyl carrier protein